jgi:S1-C subfamily serine protease
MKTTIFYLLMVSSQLLFSQNISDILENSLSGVVTVAVIETKETNELLGYRGTNVAYDKKLNLSGFSGSGSGFIIEVNGKKYVVTNAHVVESADDKKGNLCVFSISRKKYPVRVLGGDSFFDIAVLEFISQPGNEIKSLTFNDKELRIGEDVYAIGNPMGQFPYSVSEGIISGKNRTSQLPLTGKFGFLQTTATLTWGNSGGPLINKEGKVVGINSQIFFDQNKRIIQPQINFALECSIAKKIINDIFNNNGLVRRAFCGLEISQRYEVQDYENKVLIPIDTLPVITNIIPGSPAASVTGITSGAEIRAINGNQVQNINEVQREFEQLLPGQKVEFTLYFKGREQKIFLQTQLLDLPQLTSIGRFLFENQLNGYLSVGSNSEILIKLPDFSSNNQFSEGFTTKPGNSSVGKKTGMKEKVLLSAGLNNDESSQLWRIKKISDVGAILRLCGPAGFISINMVKPGGNVIEPLDIPFFKDGEFRQVVWN